MSAALPNGGPEPVVLSWSGGKDSALALAALRASGTFAPVALLTCVTSGYDRVSIHGVRRDLLSAQAEAIGLPLLEMQLEPSSSNAAYEEAFGAALGRITRQFPAVQAIAFGDLFLEDVRRYREALLEPLGFRGLFPLWGRPTPEVARSFVDRGYRARLVCVDTTSLPARFVGREYDDVLLADLPAGVDPCGERGEFHTFVTHGPEFARPVRCAVGEIVVREERFAYCDLTPLGNLDDGS